MNKTTILDILKSNQTQLNALGVRRVGLFGSRVRETPRPDSDIDLLVEFTPGRKNFDNFMQVCDLLENSLPYPVDVVTAESLSPYLKPHILKEVEYVNFSA